MTEVKPKNKGGRPVGSFSTYTEELGSRILSELAVGRSLTDICKEEWSPPMITVLKWLRIVPGFRDAYKAARELQAEAMFEEMMEIADGAGDDMVQVNKAKLRVDTRRWALARMSPKSFGDKVQQEVTGADGGPVTSLVKISFE